MFVAPCSAALRLLKLHDGGASLTLALILRSTSGIYPRLSLPSFMCPGISVVEMAAGDLPQAVALLNKCYRGSHEFVEYTPENCASYIRLEGARAYVLKEEGVRGIATLIKSGWGNKVDLFAVEPGPRSREYGDILVGEVERAASADRLYTLLEEGDESIGEWEARGYAKDGGWLQMIAQLQDEVPMPKISCLAKLRTMQQSDLGSIVSLANSSFGFERLSMDCLDEWKKEDLEFGTDWIFVAECGGAPVSMLVSKPDTEYNINFEGKRGYFGPAATLPDYRNKGLATALTVMAMNSLRRKGMRQVNLYTSIHNAPSIQLLRKLGFQPSCKYIQLSKSFKK
jgi:ribosomal protein S18 acetylase RimI-like enzyme